MVSLVHCKQGSAENGVGSSVELRYHVKKRGAQILRSDPTLSSKFSTETTQADAYVNHAHQTSAARVVTNLIKLKHRRVKKTVFTLDSHMLTSSSFFSLQTQHDQSQGNKTQQNTKTRNRTRPQREDKAPSVGLSYVKFM